MAMEHWLQTGAAYLGRMQFKFSPCQMCHYPHVLLSKKLCQCRFPVSVCQSCQIWGVNDLNFYVIASPYGVSDLAKDVGTIYTWLYVPTLLSMWSLDRTGGSSGYFNARFGCKLSSRYFSKFLLRFRIKSITCLCSAGHWWHNLKRIWWYLGPDR